MEMAAVGEVFTFSGAKLAWVGDCGSAFKTTWVGDCGSFRVGLYTSGSKSMFLDFPIEARTLIGSWPSYSYDSITVNFDTDWLKSAGSAKVVGIYCFN